MRGGVKTAFSGQSGVFKSDSESLGRWFESSRAQSGTHGEARTYGKASDIDRKPEGISCVLFGFCSRIRGRPDRAALLRAGPCRAWSR